MVWGCMTIYGLSNLVFLDKNVDKTVYLKILKQNLIQTADKYNMDRFIFQHDGAPAHKAEIIEEWLAMKGIYVMPWAAQSPDLNPIEHIWALMKRRIGRKVFNNVEDLKKELLKIWSEITPKECKDLIMSMPRRVAAVLDANGYQTKY